MPVDGIERRPAPLRAAVEARKYHGLAVHGKRHELPVRPEGTELFQCPIPETMSRLGQPLARERRGLHGKRLRFRRHFAGHVARRILPVFDRETAARRSRGRTSKRSPISWSARRHPPSRPHAARAPASEARENRDPRYRASRTGSARCARRCRLSSASRQLAIQIVADAVRAIEIAGRGTGRNVDDAALPVDRHTRPSYWPRRCKSRRPSATFRSRARRAAGWCGTSSAAYRCARRRRGYRRAVRAALRVCARPR